MIRICGVIFLGLLTGCPLPAQDSIYYGFGGYIRAGYGVDGHGNPHDVFRAPHADAKYRLGNEAETYAEFLGSYNMRNEEGASFETAFRMAVVTPTSKSNSFETTLSLREAFVKAGGILRNRQISFWAGQRFYERLEVHINDYFPRDMSGFGGGIEGIPLGKKAKLATALMGGSIDDLESDGTVRPVNQFSFNKSTLDLAVYDVDIGYGKLALAFGLSNFSGDVVETPTGDFEILNNLGWSASIYHELGFGGGRNFIQVFYGSGAAENGKAVITQPGGLEIAAGDRIDPAGFSRFRIIEDLKVDFSPKFSLLGLLIYQHIDNGMDQNAGINWYSAGTRPVFFFNRYFALVGELGWDYTSREGMDKGSLLKFTIAPQISPLNKILTRPALRAYFTYATWSDSFMGEVAPVSFPGQTQGLSLGLQMEVWW